MTMGPLPMMRTDLMLLSLGIFFLSERLLLKQIRTFGQEQSDLTLCAVGKITGRHGATPQLSTSSFSTRNPRCDLRAVTEPLTISQGTSFFSQGWTWRGKLFLAENPTRIVVAFHGFGRSMEEMANHLPLYPSNTSMLSIGLAHHNGSLVPDHSNSFPVLEPGVFHQAIEGWLAELGFSQIPKHLLGYSLGGRIALTLFERFPLAYHGMILLAPDGFKKTILYRFAAETALGRACWAFMDRHGEATQRLIRGLHHFKIIPTHLKRFALQHTKDHAMRQLVIQTWETHRLFWPSRTGTERAWCKLPERGVHVIAVFGSRDTIVPWAWSKPWQRMSSSHVHFLTIQSGHIMHHPDTVEELGNVIFKASNET